MYSYTSLFLFPCATGPHLHPAAGRQVLRGAKGSPLTGPTAALVVVVVAGLEIAGTVGVVDVWQSAQFCRCECEQIAIRTESYWLAAQFRLNGWLRVRRDCVLFRPRQAKWSRLQYRRQWAEWVLQLHQPQPVLRSEDAQGAPSRSVRGGKRRRGDWFEPRQRWLRVPAVQQCFGLLVSCTCRSKSSQLPGYGGLFPVFISNWFCRFSLMKIGLQTGWGFRANQPVSPVFNEPVAQPSRVDSTDHLI